MEEQPGEVCGEEMQRRRRRWKKGAKEKRSASRGVSQYI
jgi:hypothetical protein